MVAWALRYEATIGFSPQVLDLATATSVERELWVEADTHGTGHFGACPKRGEHLKLAVNKNASKSTWRSSTPFFESPASFGSTQLNLETFVMLIFSRVSHKSGLDWG